MMQSETVNPVELGRYLTHLRDNAGLKQGELARKITWSPAVLSRVEAGDRPLAPEELETILTAIGTSEAERLKDSIQREWAVIPRPSLDHPDQDLLWNAEEVAKELEALRQQPDLRHAFERRLAAYVNEIQQTAGLLLKRDHQIAFIGSIGIGKSTAICRLTDLEVPGKEAELPTPVLEAGAGGITICEVHLRTGPCYGLMIEPRSDDEIRADVTEFAEFLYQSDADATVETDPESSGDSQGISKEIERAVRNMSGLKIRREKRADRKTIRRDDAKDLAKRLGSVRELVVEILARMELHRRDRRDIWYDSACGKTEVEWLKDTFEQVNNGRHPSFTLPKRIEVVVPRPLLGESDLAIRIIDTKGIDRTAARADLEVHLDDPHTVVVLCSPFNSAGSGDPRVLLERALDAGIRTLESHSTMLVLPRPNEALAVKDESGMRVETVEEGYELKGEQVAMALQPLRLRDYGVEFFNAHQDDPDHVRKFLMDRIGRVREAFRSRLREITANAKALLENHEQEQVQEVMRHAATMLQTWVVQKSSPRTLSAHIQESLMSELAKAYASTIRATIRREGEWANLSYSHHLGYGARRVAALSLSQNVDGFAELCQTMAANPEYTEAQDLINQAQRVLLASYEELLRKVQLMGQTSFRDELKIDSSFWNLCNSEWGRGPGYRDRVTDHNSDWFRAKERQDLEKELWTLIDREWKDALTNLTALFDQDQQGVAALSPG